MKQTTIYFTLSLLMLAGLLSSCIKDDYGKASDTATVNLRFSTRAADAPADGQEEGVPAGKDEGIKTLRIIVTNAEGQIVKNEKRDYRDGQVDGVQNVKQITLFDVPVGKNNFYVIANEESLGKTYTNEVLAGDDWEQVDGKRKLLYLDETRTYFPRRVDEIAEKGLPITSKMEIDVKPDMEPVTIPIRHAVAKMNLKFVNTTQEEIVINQIQLGAFAADRIYLFPELQLDVPDDAGYAPVVYGGDAPLALRVPAEGEASFVCYMYPSFAWKEGLDSPYTMALVTAKGTYEPRHFVGDNQKPLNSIARNTQLNVTATIKGTSSLVINFEVTDWYAEDVTVPPFN